MPFYFSSSVGLTQIHDPYQVTSMGTRTEMFPPKTKPATRRIFIPDQHDRVFIVTGGTSRCGFEVAKALYNLKGRVYIRRSYAEAAITGIKNAPPAEDQVVKGGRGELFFIQLDLGDLSIIKSSAEEIPRATT